MNCSVVVHNPDGTPMQLFFNTFNTQDGVDSLVLFNGSASRPLNMSLVGVFNGTSMAGVTVAVGSTPSLRCASLSVDKRLLWA